MNALRTLSSLSLASALLIAGCGLSPEFGNVSQSDLIPTGEESAQAVSAADGGGESTEAPDGGAGRVRYSTHVQPIFDVYCTPCHTSASPGGALRLDAGMSHSAMVNRPVRAACNDGGMNTTLVVPSDAGHSALWLKISDDPNKCGQRMPPAGNMNRPGLPLEDQATIRAWIEQGAQND